MRSRSIANLAVITLTCGLFCFQLSATLTVSATTALTSPQPVGTPILIEASATDTGPGPINYRFEIGQNGMFSMKMDYSIQSTFSWAPTSTDGTYQIVVIARDNSTHQTSQVVLPFVIASRITGGAPVVNPTQHPLVALFSAPSCPAGSQMRVKFVAPFDPTPFHTNFQNCATTSMNFMIGGLRASTAAASYTYRMNYELRTGSTITPDTNILSFTTGQVPATISLPSYSFNVPDGGATSQAERVVVIGGTQGPLPFANDLKGDLIWYYNNSGIWQVTRMVEGGFLMSIDVGPGTNSGPFGPNVTQQQLVREEDIAGNVIHQTSADRLSEQILAGVPNGLDRFNHEARVLPNGDFLVLAETQQIFPPGTQGYTTQIDLIGPVILILNQNFQVKYYWNVFDHVSGQAGNLNINRPSQYYANCSPNTMGQTPDGCPPVVLYSPAYDWLHTNCLQLTTDGDILFSMRNQNWLAKIDYNNGNGTNNILWTMGLDGDFQFVGSTDPYPWFSGQHDANFQFNGMTTLSVFDDSDERYNQGIGDGNSRGQVLSVDESAMTVSFILNADLGISAYALGSAQPLNNGDWFFSASRIRPSETTTQAIEVQTSGTQSFNEGVDVIVYRSFRLTDFYNVPLE